MKLYGREHKRRFGQWLLRIHRYSIDIQGDWHTNSGLIYPHMVERFVAGEDCQIIGMDNNYGMTKTVKAYIYDYVRKFSKRLAAE